MYLNSPKSGSQTGRNNMYKHDTALGFSDVNFAELHGAADVCLPMCTIKQDDCAETLEKHPCRVFP